MTDPTITRLDELVGQRTDEHDETRKLLWLATARALAERVYQFNPGAHYILLSKQEADGAEYVTPTGLLYADFTEIHGHRVEELLSFDLIGYEAFPDNPVFLPRDPAHPFSAKLDPRFQWFEYDHTWVQTRIDVTRARNINV